MSEQIYALILAAGKGTRMKSDRNKVLHHVGGLPMIEQVLLQLQALAIENIGVVVGHLKNQIIDELGDKVRYIEQTEQLGTGHAVKVASDWLSELQGTTIVLCGDTPLLTKETLTSLIDVHKQGGAACTVLTAVATDPTGYGRIIRDEQGKVIKIVEQKDASVEERKVQEVNAGIYCFDNKLLFAALEQITDQNAQGEYYLTDVVEIFNSQKQLVLPCVATAFEEIVGVNDRVALAKANKIMRTRILEGWMLNGVTIIDTDSTYIDTHVTIGRDVTIYPGVHLRGTTTIGNLATIGPNTEIEDSQIDDGSRVRQSVVIKSAIGQATQVGPFAYIRPGSVIGNNVKIGDFVEIKNASIGNESKVSHLSYIGDAEVGQSVNIGCGTVTVNYDGKHKYKTIIEDNSFIGCNSNLVAPVTVAENSYIAAGSTITNDVPNNSLAIARSRQVNKLNYIKKT